MARYVLNDESYALLREIFRAYKDEIFGSEAEARREEQVDYLPPEVYVAITPGGGIAAYSQGTETGTGTGATGDDTPGSAKCKVYRVLGAGPTASMHRVGNLEVLVYNLSRAAVDANTPVLIQRDKFGKWFVSGGAVSVDSPAMSVTVNEFVRVDCEASGTGGDFTVKIVTRPVLLTAAGLTAVPGTEVSTNIITVDNNDFTFLTDVDVTAECVDGVITTTVTETDATVTVPTVTCG